MFKDKNILKYYKRFALILAIGIMADILVDFVQLFIPQYLGEVVQIVGFSINPTYDDISNIVIKIIIVAIALFLGRIIMRFTILYASGKI